MAKLNLYNWRNLPLVFISGPCAIESYVHNMFMADKINNISDLEAMNIELEKKIKNKYYH